MCEKEREIIEQYKQKFDAMNIKMLQAFEEVRELKKLVKVGSSIRSYQSEPSREDLQQFANARIKLASLEEVVEAYAELTGQSVEKLMKVRDR